MSVGKGLRSLRAAMRSMERDVDYHVSNAAGEDPANRQLYESTVRWRRELRDYIERAEAKQRK